MKLRNLLKDRLKRKIACSRSAALLSSSLIHTIKIGPFDQEGANAPSRAMLAALLREVEVGRHAVRALAGRVELADGVGGAAAREL